MTDRAPLPPINFAALNAALLPMAETLVRQWLPDGEKVGVNYMCGSTAGGKGSSCGVNVKTGAWSDFATGEAGRDLISLYAANMGLSPAQAAIQLANDHGLTREANIKSGAPNNAAPVAPRPVPTPPPAAANPGKEKENWHVISPVPDNAVKPNFWHHEYNNDAQGTRIDHVAEYRIDDLLYGYVIRFIRSEGGKVTLPYMWCESLQRGDRRWVWRGMDGARALYLPGGTSPGGRVCILVEGEKKASILQALLDQQHQGTYCVVSWLGGCKNWSKSDWSPLAGCEVLMWPDCDAKRVPLPNAEVKAFARDDAGQLALQLAQQAQPLLAPEKQPGMAAMRGIGALLRDEFGCHVSMLKIPAAGEKPDGWDCADAINDGWDADHVMVFFGTAQKFVDDAGGAKRSSPDDSPPAKKIDGPATADSDDAAGDDDQDDEFAAYIKWVCDTAKIKPYELGINRKLVIGALRTAPDLKECLGFNLLMNAPGTRHPWPWRGDAGPLNDNDDLRLGDYLSARYKIKPASRAALSEAIETVADERPYHPVRDWIKSVAHDGVTRIDKWLIHALGYKPDTMTPALRAYLGLVGRYLVMGLVARVMDPGCKFDYSPVFEGKPGAGKSTLAKTLVGADYFSDTHFDIGNGKDGMEQLEGLWCYELSEMTAFRRADNEQVKQFFSSQVDRFRGAYGKYVQKHPRQCVIICTTNKRQYLYDLTGNRRFWPVAVANDINTDWVQKYRGQLFAEALKLYESGKRYTPSREEEALYFEPQQKMRLVETAVQSQLYQLLTREGAATSMEGTKTSELSVYTTFVTLDQMVRALGTDAAKSNTMLEGQIRGWFDAQGWEYVRETTGARRRGYRQPAVWPPKIEDDADVSIVPDVDQNRSSTSIDHGDDDSEPF